MVSDELIDLLHNLDHGQVEIIKSIAIKIASASTEKWTGKINFELNANNGSFCDMHVQKSEVVRFRKKRRVRSSGL